MPFVLAEEVPGVLTGEGQGTSLEKSLGGHFNEFGGISHPEVGCGPGLCHQIGFAERRRPDPRVNAEKLSRRAEPRFFTRGKKRRSP